MKAKSGILVTGGPRTGTTWVGKMLAGHEDYVYLHEPFNSQFTKDSFGEEPFPHWFMYLDKSNEADYIDKVSRMINVKRSWLRALLKVRGFSGLKQFVKGVMYGTIGVNDGKKPLVKDPIAVFSSHWLAETFDLSVVFMVRHPGAYVSSLMKLGWNANANAFLRQDKLKYAYLEPLVDEIKHYHVNGSDLEKAAMMWKSIYFVAEQLHKQTLDWLVVRQEDLASSPVEGFKKIYNNFNLEFTRDIEKLVIENSSDSNPASPDHHWQIKRDSASNVDAWKGSFDSSQLETIKSIVGDVASKYYSDSEW